MDGSRFFAEEETNFGAATSLGLDVNFVGGAKLVGGALGTLGLKGATLVSQASGARGDFFFAGGAAAWGLMRSVDLSARGREGLRLAAGMHVTIGDGSGTAESREALAATAGAPTAP